MQESPSSPAPLGRRLAAVALDYLVISAYMVILVLLALLAGTLAPWLADALFANAVVGELTGFVVLTLPVTLYFALSEASAAGATWGKRRMRLRVLTDDGRQLSLGRSLLRSAVKFMPWELAHASIWQFRFAAGDASQLLPTVGLAVTWLLVAITILSVLLDRRRRALHDRVARTVVAGQ